MSVNINRCPAGTMEYTIRAGDTFYSLAIRFNTTVEAIQAANPGVDPNNLQIGQRICIPAAPPSPVCPPGSFPYIIRSGDTLFSLAQRFNTTVGAIMAINPGIDPNNLMIGQRICIPSAGLPPVCPPGSTSYTIRPGDTLFSLAQRFNTTVSAILALNPGLDPNNLQVGRIICIPVSQPTVCPPGTFTYVIRAGDTFYSLAIRFNTTIAAIQAANPGVNPNNLQIGQRICIPIAPPSPVCPPGSFPYIIRPGDTLFLLAQRFNTTVSAIMAINPGINPNNLMIGQRICIPSM